ncbi:MAG: Spy/CpxP family protein refolding chaperone [Gemmatimonadetes bacterium]|nr:Spy/CpxP family protein refolding chaperone [Gemmatimonadota bacterium]
MKRAPMFRTLSIAAGATALVFTAAASGLAQPGAGRAPAGQLAQAARVPGPPPGPTGNTPAAHLLHMREHLKLTDDQVKRLESLHTSQTAALAPQRGAALRVAADMADAMQGEPNIAAARAAMEKGARLRIDQAIARLQAAKDARAVLTADQKAQVDAMRPMMRNARMGGMRGGMMRGGMMRGGMMEGGMMGGRQMAPMGPPQGEFERRR